MLAMLLKTARFNPSNLDGSAGQAPAERHNKKHQCRNGRVAAADTYSSDDEKSSDEERAWSDDFSSSDH
jgi:hypothetical protein